MDRGRRAIFLVDKLEESGYDLKINHVDAIVVEMNKSIEGWIRTKAEMQIKLANLASFSTIGKPFTPAELQMVSHLYGDFGRNWQFYTPFFYSRSKFQIARCYTVLVAQRIGKKVAWYIKVQLTALQTAAGVVGASMKDWVGALSSLW